MPSALARINQSVWNDYLEAQDARLPVLPPVQQLSTRVIRILGGNAGVMRLQGTNTYIVGTGKSRLLVDTGQGEASWINHIRQVLADLDVTLSHVLLTHWHSDHTGGVPDLIAHRPECVARIYKCDPDRNQKAIAAGDVFRVEGATVRAVFTPGHAHDHMCFELDEENALFTGDNVLGHGQSVFEDLGLFTKSLWDMANRNCQLGYPAHGDVLRDLPRKMLEVIKQREYHECQVYQALAGTSGRADGKRMTVSEIAETLYGLVECEVYRLAIEESVVGALSKLAEDRKVGFGMADGQKRWFIRERGARSVVKRPNGVLSRTLRENKTFN